MELTDHEFDILTMIANGASNRELASYYERDISTIKHWLTLLYKKLSASNRVHAVALAYHKGILIPKRSAP